MLTLANLTNPSRPLKKVKRVGRGLGSGLGKTCGRGEKGAGARSGYKRRHTYEGGQFRMFMKMPVRGFSNVRFKKSFEAINLEQIDEMFEDSEVVNIASLKDRGYIKGRNMLLKILGGGSLTKKVKIEAHAISETAKDKLKDSNIQFHLIEKRPK